MPATYENIATTTLTGTQASVTFNSISGYTDLYLVVTGYSTRTNTQDIPTIQFNGDTGSNYSATNLDGSASGATSTRWTNETKILLGFINDSNATSNSPGNPSYVNVNIMNYANSTTNKTVISRYGHTSTNSTYNRTGSNVGLWRSTAAITSVTIGLYYASWVSGSTFTLYGIKAA